MQFSVSKNVLLSHLQKVSKVAPTRSTMPILNSILFELQGDNLTLRASDFEITISSNIPVNGTVNGLIAIPSRLIYDIVNEVDEGEIYFNAKESGEIEIRAGKGKYEIMGRPGDEFPTLPDINVFNVVEIEKPNLLRLIQKTIIAVSKDELKQALTGVLFQIRKNEIRSVATDGHRLVCLIRKDFISKDFERDIIIPVKFLNLISGYLNEDGKISLSIGENHVKVEADSAVIFTRLIDERFPDYESVIPTDNDKIIKAEVTELVATLRRVAIFANKTTHQISIRLKEGEAAISTVDQESRSAADENIAVEYIGDEILIGFNVDYLREIIRNIDTDKVIIKLKTPVSASLILPEEQKENEEMLMLLMPIRLID